MIKEILFEHTVPVEVIRWGLASALVIVLLSFWRYLRRAFGTWTLVVLRVLFMAALGWCLFCPAEWRHESEQVKPRFLVIADTSASMGMTPRKGIPTRWDVAQEVLRQPWTSALASKTELDGYGFDTTVTSKLAVKDLAALPVKGDGTRLRDALHDVLDRYKGQPLAGVLLLTDGLDTREVSDEWTAGPWPAPIYTVQLEPPDSWEETPDVHVVTVDTPRRVEVGWRSELTAVIGATGTKGVPFNVQLYENGKLIQEIPTQIPAAGGTKEVKFQLDHETVGNFVYKVKVPPLPKQTVLEKNEFPVSVAVIHSNNRVLYVDGVPRFEFKFLKRALERNKDISPMMMLQGDDGKLMSVGSNGNVDLTMSPEQLSEFKIVILGDLDATTLGDERARALVKYVEDGGSLVLLGGDGAWSAHGFATTPLNDLLPVQLDASGIQERNFTVSLTKDGETDPALKSLAAAWTKPMPVLSIYPVASVSRGATAVMTAGGEPLIVTERFGQGKVAAILSNSLWRWQLEPGQKDEYLAFWDGLLQWLVPQASEVSPFSLDLTADVEQLFLGDTITLTARLGSSQAAAPVSARVNLEIRAPDGHNIPFVMQSVPASATAAKSSPGYTVTYNADAGGMHYAIASATINGRKIESAPFSFFVRPFTPELSPRAQDFAGLKALSQASGGQFCDKDKLNEVLSALEVKAGEEERAIYENLYDSPYLLGALMTFLGADWIIRKRRNMA